MISLNFLSLSPIFSSSSKHPFGNPNFQTMSIISPCKPLQNPKASTTFSFLTFLPPPSISIYKAKAPVKLDQENFLIRRQLFEPVIKEHRLHRFLNAASVNGCDDGDSNNDDFDKKDRFHFSWLFSSLSLSMLTQLQLLVRAKAMQYRSEMNNITKNRAESISEYLFRIKILIDSLAVAKRPVNLQEHVDTILLGLPEEYEAVVTVLYAILMTGPCTVEEIEYMLLVLEPWIYEE